MHKVRLIYGYKFFRCQIKIVILPGSCNRAYWEQIFSRNSDRNSAIVLQKADKDLNSSQARTSLFYFRFLYLQLGRRKAYKEDVKSREKADH